MEIHPQGNLVKSSVASDSFDQLGFRAAPFSAILGDPGADSECNGKSKRAEKMAVRKVENGIFFPARLDFPLPPLSTPRSPRTGAPAEDDF